MTATAIRSVAIKIDDDTRARVQREAFRQDTLKAWEECRTTGLHVSADEADAWLPQLEQGKNIEPPECSRLIWSRQTLLDVKQQVN